jgi:heat shock protein HtpX
VNEQLSANRRKALVVVARFFAIWFIVFLIVALLLGGGVMLMLPIVIAVAATVAAYSASEAVTLRLAHAVPADEMKHARFQNLVEGLCIGSGIPQPALFVVDDPAPNALACGRNPKNAAMVVTTGLLEKLNRVELEGVVAHELSHIRDLDILPMTLVVTMWPVRKGFGPLMDSADAAGVLMTRYPPGLIAALKKLDDDHNAMKAPSKAVAHLWIEDPVAAAPLTDRIHALEAL